LLGGPSKQTRSSRRLSSRGPPKVLLLLLVIVVVAAAVVVDVKLIVDAVASRANVGRAAHLCRRRDERVGV
jgi:hypothetical protein